MEMDEDEIDELMRQQAVGRIGCHAGGQTYVVPVIYVWEAPCVYVYSAEGRKIQMMRENPAVCFEVDERRPDGGWRSVIIGGAYEELAGGQAARTRDLLAARFGSRPASRSEDQGAGGQGVTAVAFRIRADQITGRKVER